MSEKLTFRALGATEEPIAKLNRREARTGYRIFKGADGFEVAIAVDVIERALHLGRAAAPKEWCGRLLGRVADDAEGRHVVVVALVPDPGADAREGFVETSHTSEAEVRGLSERLFPDAIQLGWIHGHTGYGARFSDRDKATQRRWTLPHSLGIVVDPFHSLAIGVYRGPEAELLTPVIASTAVPPAPKSVMTTPSVGTTRCETRPCERPRPRRTTVPIVALACAVALLLGVVIGRRLRRDDERIVLLTQREEELERRLHFVEDNRYSEPVVPSIVICDAPERPMVPSPAPHVEPEVLPSFRPSPRPNTPRTR